MSKLGFVCGLGCLGLVVGCDDDGGGGGRRDGSVGEGGVDAAAEASTEAGPTDAGPSDGGVDAPVGDAPTGSSCQGADCNLLTNGCATVGDGCFYGRAAADAGASIMCVPAGAGENGATCTFVNDCASGFYCNSGTCRKFCCDGDTSACPADTLCNVSSGSVALGFCDACVACDLVAQTGCGTDLHCYPVLGSNTQCTGCYAPTTQSPQTVAEGASCTSNAACAPGLGCYGLSGNPLACTKFCTVDAASGCDGGKTCQSPTGWDWGTLGLCA